MDARCKPHIRVSNRMERAGLVVRNHLAAVATPRRTRPTMLATVACRAGLDSVVGSVASLVRPPVLRLRRRRIV